MSESHSDELEIGHSIPSLTLRQLTYFLAAAKHQSVLKAAQMLNVSSPSVSMAISQLETNLNLHLFERRHARGLVLTPAGSNLASHVRNILLQVREIEVSGQRGISNKAIRLNIGCLHTLAPHVLPAMMRKDDTLPTSLQISWTEDNHEHLIAALHDGALDLAILYDYDLPTTLHTTEIRAMPIQVVLPANHRLALKRSCNLHDLAEEQLILLDQAKTRDYFLSLFSDEGLEPRIGHRTQSFETLRSLVANEVGYTLLNFAPPYVSDGRSLIVSRPLIARQSQKNLVLARLYRFRAPPLYDELSKAIREIVARLAISC